MKTYQTIEMGRGETYRNSRFTVYEHGVYPRSSVLAGRPSRQWLDDFDTLAEAQAAYPKAEPIGGTTWREDKMLDLPGEDDPQDDGEDIDFHSGEDDPQDDGEDY